MEDHFQDAYQLLKKKEGGWVDDKDDRGGETFCGITRKNWGKETQWLWDKLDKCETKESKNKLLDDLEVDLYIKDFYSRHFWNGKLCDILGNKELACSHFLNFVHSYSAAVRILQVLANKHAGQSLDTDGVIGPRTRAGVSELNKLDGETIAKVVDEYNDLREKFLIQLAENDESQRQFLAGWLGRDEVV